MQNNVLLGYYVYNVVYAWKANNVFYHKHIKLIAMLIFHYTIKTPTIYNNKKTTFCSDRLRTCLIVFYSMTTLRLHNNFLTSFYF